MDGCSCDVCPVVGRDDMSHALARRSLTGSGYAAAPGQAQEAQQVRAARRVAELALRLRPAQPPHADRLPPRTLHRCATARWMCWRPSARQTRSCGQGSWPLPAQSPPGAPCLIGRPVRVQPWASAATTGTSTRQSPRRSRSPGPAPSPATVRVSGERRGGHTPKEQASRSTDRPGAPAAPRRHPRPSGRAWLQAPAGASLPDWRPQAGLRGS